MKIEDKKVCINKYGESALYQARLDIGTRFFIVNHTIKS